MTFGTPSNNMSGNRNTAEGVFALMNNSSGTNNIGLGYNAGANIGTGNNNIDIGNSGYSTDTNIIRIGDPTVHTATYLAGTVYATNLSASGVSASASTGTLWLEMRALAAGPAIFNNLAITATTPPIWAARQRRAFEWNGHGQWHLQQEQRPQCQG